MLIITRILYTRHNHVAEFGSGRIYVAEFGSGAIWKHVVTLPGHRRLLAYWLFLLFSRHISRTQSFQQNRHVFVHALVALKLLVSLKSHLVACSVRILNSPGQTDRRTRRTTTVTLAAHARRGLTRRMQCIALLYWAR